MTLIVRIFHPIICLIIISSRQENYSITFTLDCPVFTIKTAVLCSTHNNNNIFIPNEIMIIIYNIKDIIIITVYLPSFRIYTIIIVHMSCKGQIYFGSDRQLLRRFSELCLLPPPRLSYYVLCFSTEGG